MSGRLNLTPNARNALHTVGIDRFVLLGRIPKPWALLGDAPKPNGPYRFTALNDETQERHNLTAYSLRDLPAVVEKALLWMGSDDLESTLAASLAARGITA